MRDVTTKWIDTIPSNWERKRLKDVFTFGSGLSISKEDLQETGIPVISYGQIHAKFNTGVTIDDRLLRYVSPDYLESGVTSLVHEGDFIFADTSEDIEGSGNNVYVDREMQLFAGYHTVILKSREKRNNKYLAYLFQSDAWRAQIRSRVCGVKIFSITKAILNGLSIVLPPYDEQLKIVAYLDEKIASMNSYIDARSTELDLLKAFKKSKIAETVIHGLKADAATKSSPLGEVPAHWEVIRLKNFATTIKGKASDYYDEPVPGSRLVLSVDVLRTGNPQAYNYAICDDPEQLCNQDDIVMIWDGAGVGEFLRAQDGLISSTTAKFALDKDKIYSRYFWYFGGRVEEIMKHMPTGMGIPHVNPNILNNMEFAIPPLSEQQEIARYLDHECEQIDRKCALIEQQIEKLQLLKRALINEIVTGKRQIA